MLIPLWSSERSGPVPGASVSKGQGILPSPQSHRWEWLGGAGVCWGQGGQTGSPRVVASRPSTSLQGENFFYWQINGPTCKFLGCLDKEKGFQGLSAASESPTWKGKWRLPFVRPWDGYEANLSLLYFFLARDTSDTQPFWGLVSGALKMNFYLYSFLQPHWHLFKIYIHTYIYLNLCPKKSNELPVILFQITRPKWVIFSISLVSGIENEHQ